MAEFRMPSLGSDMEKGTLVEWMKKPGDLVKPGDIVAVIETEKGAIEIEAFESGTFTRALVEIGQTVPVGTPIALIDGGAPAAVSLPRAAPAPPLPPVTPKLGPPVPQVAVAPRPSKRPKISPAARKLAEERAVDLTSIAGSGADGSIVYVDVEHAISVAAAPQTTSQAPHKPVVPDVAAMQTIIAAATARAKREIPHYYLMHEADITPALKWLAKTNAKRPPDRRLLPAVLYVKSLALTLRKHPSFNGFCKADVFQPAERIHVGMAIAMRGGGLIAPAIHDTDKLTLDELMKHLRDLVARVRTGRFRSSEISDPTITLTSLGEGGVDAVMPIIYPPQVAIVGVGTPRKRPWIIAGKTRARDILTLSLAGDHRVGNGHRGALFLADWATALEQAEAL